VTEERQAEELAAQVADAVRRVVTDAEARAEQIVREAKADAARIRQEAETEATRIRERAEADARKQIDAAKRALEELGGSLAAAVEAATPKDPASEAREPKPEPEPEPEPVEPAESPGAPEAPVSSPAPEHPTVDQAASGGNGHDAAERLVAMKLAVDGKSREQIDSELTEKFGAADRSALLDDVLSRIER
jgi:hypothetical protein